jgi:membrane-associated two-gene conflict system component 1 (EACC1)
VIDPAQLSVQLRAPPGAELPDVDRRALQLRQELLAGLDVDEVRRGRAEPPADAKGVGIEWAELVVTFTGGLPGLVALLRSWLPRHRGYSIVLEIDGDRLEVEGVSADERRRLEQAWLDRHTEV